MNAELLYDAITLIDDDLIDEAGVYTPKKRTPIRWQRWAATPSSASASCFHALRWAQPIPL